jgi:hypothetical protein
MNGGLVDEFFDDSPASEDEFFDDNAGFHDPEEDVIVLGDEEDVVFVDDDDVSWLKETVEDFDDFYENDYVVDPNEFFDKPDDYEYEDEW